MQKPKKIKTEHKVVSAKFKDCFPAEEAYLAKLFATLKCEVPLNQETKTKPSVSKYFQDLISNEYL